MKNTTPEDPIVRACREEGYKIGKAEGRAMANDFLKRVRILQQKIGTDFPPEFFAWVIGVASPAEIKALESAAKTAKTFREMITKASISWVHEQRSNGNLRDTLIARSLSTSKRPAIRLRR
jgi:hypothetical protein